MIEQFAYIFFGIQLIHSVEELATGFHKKWYLFKMPFVTFFTFEICFSLFWAAVLFFQSFPFRENLLAFFIILMFANGVQHIVWWGFTKKYIPGLVTSLIHIIIFLTFYFQVIL
ncbi:MAG: HXXEE domain-containing protein [Candidatus Daviesbacteria bacterium]|nr:HXXEE domain-containing protein [Candidatus Daviesbacteria bacterium]